MKKRSKTAVVEQPIKLTKKQRDEHFASHLPSVLNYHAMMLADGLRNRLLYRAIHTAVTPDTSFLDIGAGTGVWAILAAKLGAKRVVAVEIEECLIPLIHKHAQENGVAKQIEIVHGNSDDVKLKGKFDVIVSELFGNDALGAQTIKAFVNIRDRFLKEGGTLIPQKLAMMAAPAHFLSPEQDIPAELPMKTDFLRSLRDNYSRFLPISERQKVKLLGEPQTLVEVDFRTADCAPSLNGLSLEWKLDDLSKPNAIAVFNNSTFTEKIVMDNFRSRSWGSSIYPFMPKAEGVGLLRFDITLDEKKSMWAISYPGMQGVPIQNFSPVFAAARTRMAQQLTPHKRSRSSK